MVLLGTERCGVAHMVLRTSGQLSGGCNSRLGARPPAFGLGSPVRVELDNSGLIPIRRIFAKVEDGPARA
jgi:hypothetical protein